MKTGALDPLIAQLGASVYVDTSCFVYFPKTRRVLRPAVTPFEVAMQ
jgi:hypothetical protein